MFTLRPRATGDRDSCAMVAAEWGGTMAGIENQEALTRIFGDWPSFHDAEVLSLVLGRHGIEDRPGPTLEARIHVFQMTGEVDERGYFRLGNHTLVVLR